ncbi:MAG TPA: glycine betaine ABC transporter substrate-binding protein [Bacteroidales bacterium]|nr:glycine betaine ABC transporter substrate-binding protein [Bacteroidales bacterium]
MYDSATRKIVGILLILSMIIMVSSCSGSGNNKKSEEKPMVSILYPNWAEGIAFTYLAKAALEANKFDVKLTNLEPGLIYGELSKTNSKGDVFLDAWLPNTHKDYWAKYGDKLVKLGEAFSEGTTGLVVPDYVTISSIPQLNDYKDKFDSEIIGIGAGAGIHESTEKAIKAYNLDFRQVTSSGPAMVASLEKAIKNNEWIVVTGWKPHFMWANLDLKYLKDPKNIFPKDVCAIISRRGFKEDMPKAATFFENFNLTEDQLYNLMGKIREKDQEQGAKEWYQENKSMVDGWFK